MTDESGIDVARQDSGPKTRMFSVGNIFDLARYRARKKRQERQGEHKQVIVTLYSPMNTVGKTTLTGNLSSCFALRGLRTLSIDLDFQAGLTLSLGYDPESTLEEAIETGKPLAQLVDHHLGNLMPGWQQGHSALEDVIKKPFGENGPHLVPADLTLERLDTMLTYGASKEVTVETAIAELLRDGRAKKAPHFDISGYDFVLFDASASRNRITVGALLASDYVICPVSMETCSTKVLSYVSSVLTELHEQFGRRPELIIVGNFFDSTRITATQLSMIMHTYKRSLLPFWIRRSGDFLRLREDESAVPIVLSKPGSSASGDLRNCADALLARMRPTDA